MLDVEPVILEELARLADEPAADPDWTEVVARSETDSKRWRFRRQPPTRPGALVAAVVAVAIAAAPAFAFSSTVRELVGLQSEQKHFLYDGMTPKQVVHVIGRPEARRGGCWFYRPVNHMVGPIPMGERQSIAWRYADRIRLCFSFGTLQWQYQHISIPKEGGEWIRTAF